MSEWKSHWESKRKSKRKSKWKSEWKRQKEEKETYFGSSTSLTIEAPVEGVGVASGGGVIQMTWRVGIIAYRVNKSPNSLIKENIVSCLACWEKILVTNIYRALIESSFTPYDAYSNVVILRWWECYYLLLRRMLLFTIAKSNDFLLNFFFLLSFAFHFFCQPLHPGNPHFW